MKLSTREWIAKADADFTSAGRESRARKMPNFDAACFFGQQCVDLNRLNRRERSVRVRP